MQRDKKKMSMQLFASLPPRRGDPDGASKTIYCIDLASLAAS
jgi:hypothetical protein